MSAGDKGFWIIGWVIGISLVANIIGNSSGIRSTDRSIRIIERDITTIKEDIFLAQKLRILNFERIDSHYAAYPNPDPECKKWCRERRLKE